MLNDKKRSAVGPDGVAILDCCMQQRAGKFGADDAVDVDVKLDNNGQVDLYIEGCRHVSSVIDSRPGGLVRRIRFSGRTYIIVVAEDDQFVDILHKDLVSRFDEICKKIADAADLPV